MASVGLERKVITASLSKILNKKYDIKMMKESNKVSYLKV